VLVVFLVFVGIVDVMILCFQISVTALFIVGLSSFIHLGKEGIGHRDRISGLHGGRTPLLFSWLEVSY
jgi:hypothetical protein